MKRKIFIWLALIAIFYVGCDELNNQVSFSNTILIDEAVLNSGNVFFSVYIDDPIENPGITPLQSGIVGTSEEAPLSFNSPMLTVGDTFYVVVYIDADDNDEWTFMNNRPVEPFGGYGFIADTPDLIPLVVTSETLTLPNFTIYNPGDVLENPVTFELSGIITLSQDIPDSSVLRIILDGGEYYWGDTTIQMIDSVNLPAQGTSVNYSLTTTYYYLPATLLAYIDEDNSGSATFYNRSGQKLYLEPFGGYGMDFLADDFTVVSILTGADSTGLDFPVYSQYDMADHLNLAFLGGSLSYYNQNPSGDLYIFLLDSMASLDNLSNLHIYESIKMEPADRYMLPPVETGKTYYLCGFLDSNQNDSLDLDLLGLSTEPIGAYGLHPEYYDFEMDGFMVNTHKTNLNLSILDVDSLYRQGSANVSGTIILDDSVSADSGYACVFLNDPLSSSTLLYMVIPVYFSGKSASFQFLPLWAIDQSYYFGAFIDRNLNHVLDRNENLLPLEPFGGYGTSRENPVVNPFEFSYPVTISNLEMTILPPEAFAGK